MKQPYILECTLETKIFQDDRDVNAICIQTAPFINKMAGNCFDVFAMHYSSSV